MAESNGALASGAVRVRRVHRLSRREAQAIIVAYHESFPAAQRIADSVLIGRIDEMPNSTRNAFYVAERGIDITGFADVLFFPSFRLAHLMYLCVRKQFRGAGDGLALLERVVARCRERPISARWITIEAPRPESAHAADERAARETTVRRLERVGYEKLPADFQAPPLGPGLGVIPYWIMAYPVTEARVDPADVPGILLNLYRLVYGIDETHPLVAHCLRSARRP